VKVTNAQEESIPSIWNDTTMFGDRDWPLNASRGFGLSVSAELLVLTMWYTVYIYFVCL